MFKANGRTTRRDSKQETASRYGKEFVCSACGVRKRVRSVEFGEALTCDKCGANMNESYEE